MTLIAAAAAAAYAARQAELAAQEVAGRIAAARVAVGQVLGPAVDTATLEVCELAPPIVLTDGDVCLAHDLDGVHLVEEVDGQWQDLAGPLTDLAALGEALAEAAL